MAAAAALPGPARADLGPVEVMASSGGTPRLLLAPRPGEVAVLRISFPVGSVDDRSSPGLTRLAQHALLEANRQVDPDQLFRDVWAADGELEITTGQRSCAFTLVAGRREFASLATRLAQALLSPRLDPARFDTATARAVLDVGNDDDLFSLGTALAARDRAYRTHPPHGLRRILESLDLEEVADHVRRNFTPAAAEVVVAGALDRKLMIRLFRSFHGGEAARGPRVELELPSTARIEAEREVHVLAYPILLARPRDAAAARLAAALLDDALWHEVREAGLGYSFEVRIVRSTWLDAVVLVVPAEAGDHADLGGLLRGVVERARVGRFTDEELDHARAVALAALAREDADPAALSAALASGGTAWHGAEVASALGTLDRAGLLATAGRWLDGSRSIDLYEGPRP
jgi:predicted Zn-dependent peptidase